MNRLVLATISICILLSIGSAPGFGAAGDEYWPMWRGPRATGAALKGNPPVSWSETENIKWKVKVPGLSLSTPVVWGNKMIFLTSIPTDKKAPAPNPAPRAGGDRFGGRGGGGRGGRGGFGSRAPSAVHKFDVVCMDRRNGTIIWQKTAKEVLPHEGHQSTNSFASYSPVTDGKYIWASFGSRGAHCYDLDGNHKWSRDLGEMRTRAGFGEGSSPAIAGDALIVVMDQESDSAIYALNKNTGKTIWKKDRDERTSWGTPLPIEVEGELQVVVNATNFVRSYDPGSGEIVWQCSGQTVNVVPSPVTGFGMVFCTSGYRGSALQAIKLGKKGDLSGSDAISWQINEGTPYVPSPVLHGDKIYFCSSNRAVVSCYQAETGKANFVGRTLEGVGSVYASPVAVGDRVYFAGRGGVCQVIKHSDKFEVLATNTLKDGFDSSPVIVGDELYLKGKENLYCIASKR